MMTMTMMMMMMMMMMMLILIIIIIIMIDIVLISNSCLKQLEREHALHAPVYMAALHGQSAK